MSGLTMSPRSRADDDDGHQDHTTTTNKGKKNKNNNDDDNNLNDTRNSGATAAEPTSADDDEQQQQRMLMMAAASGLSPEELEKAQEAGILPMDFLSGGSGGGADGSGFAGLLGAAAPIDTPIEEQLRRILVHFFICYAPHRLNEVPSQLQRLLHSGATAIQAYKKLKNEYGCVPVEGEAEAVMKASFTTRLYVFFARHNPSQFRNVPYIAKKYVHCQRELMVELETKYGTDHDPLKLFSAVQDDDDKEDMDRFLDDGSDSSSDHDASNPITDPSRGNFGPADGSQGNLDQSGRFDKDDKNNVAQPDQGTYNAAADNNNNNQNDLDDDDDDDFNQTTRNFDGTIRKNSLDGAAGGDKENKGPGLSSSSSAHRYVSEEEVQGALTRVGVNPYKLRQPLPRFHQDPSVATTTKVAAEDYEML